jgi:prepilin-type N-terminal cleavage/methylation domain-containing protein
MEMRKKGYTLVEIMVAVSLFSTVMAVLVSFFSNSIQVQKEILSSQEMINSVSYSMEYMSRALRMARKDDMNGVNCLVGSKVNYELSEGGIKFVNYNGDCQNFYLQNGRLVEWKSVDEIESTNYLTPESINIDYFSIGPSDSWDQEDDLQPKVTIYLKARVLSVVDASEQTEIKIQTTVSQRNLDVRY